MSNHACKLLFSLTLVAAAAGCSGGSDDPFGPDPDYTTHRAEYQAPSGAFAAGNESAVFSTYVDRRAALSQVALAALAQKAVGGARTEAAPAKTTVSDSLSAARIGGASFCAALHRGDASGACACPGGGTLFYDTREMSLASSGGATAPSTLRVRYEACGVDGAILEGREFLQVKPGANLEAISQANVVVRAQGKTATIDLSFLWGDGKWWSRVTSGSGEVIVAGSPEDASGKRVFVVKDRDTTWTCEVRSGAEPSPWEGTCSSGKGEKRVVKGSGEPKR